MLWTKQNEKLKLLLLCTGVFMGMQNRGVRILPKNDAVIWQDFLIKFLSKFESSIVLFHQRVEDFKFSLSFAANPHKFQVPKERRQTCWKISPIPNKHTFYLESNCSIVDPKICRSKKSFTNWCSYLSTYPAILTSHKQ